MATEDGQMAEKGGGWTDIEVGGGTEPNSPIEVVQAQDQSAAVHCRCRLDCRNEQPMRNFLEDAENFFQKGKFNPQGWVTT